MRTLHLAVAVLFLRTAATAAALPGEPIRLAWVEGDVAGTSTIYGPDGTHPIGIVEYRQVRHGDILSGLRVARFHDGSSDEDRVEARVAGRLEALSGRTIIRDTRGEAIVDLEIHVPDGRLRASWLEGAQRRTLDERIPLSAGTYWGPLVFLVLKNFAANAEDGRLVFRTVVPTPRPRVLDMEFSRGGADTIERAGLRLAADRFALRPTIHWAVDPVVRLVAPPVDFWMLAGEPPALARFSGPRNYQRQAIRIQ